MGACCGAGDVEGEVTAVPFGSSHWFLALSVKQFVGRGQ